MPMVQVCAGSLDGSPQLHVVKRLGLKMLRLLGWSGSGVELLQRLDVKGGVSQVRSRCRESADVTVFPSFLRAPEA